MLQKAGRPAAIKLATLYYIVLHYYLFFLKAKKLLAKANQLRHLGSLRLLTLSLLAKMFQRACRQKQPEQRLFLLSASQPLKLYLGLLQRASKLCRMGGNVF